MQAGNSLWYVSLCPGKMGISLSEIVTGDDKGRECGRRVRVSSSLDCAEAELDVIYTQPTSGSGSRRRNHYLPPESCPSHVAVSAFI